MSVCRRVVTALICVCVVDMNVCTVDVNVVHESCVFYSIDIYSLLVLKRFEYNTDKIVVH